MKDQPLPLRVLVLPLAFALLAVPVAAHADAVTCQRVITKGAAKYVQNRAKAIQKCQDSRMRGKLPAATNCDADSTTNAITAASRQRFMSSVGGACGGSDGTCGGSGDLSLASIGWGSVPQCPTLDGSSCSMPITTCADIVTCVACLDDQAVRKSYVIASGSLNASAFGTSSATNKCQRAIGKATSKYLGTTTKALSKCWDGRLSGQHSNACPVPGDGKATKVLARAELKKVTAICRACGGADRACNGSGDATAAEVGLPASCPSVTPPGGTSCAGAISSMSNMVACLDCVADYEGRCADAAAVPGLESYPPACGASSGTTTSTTVTPVSTTTSTTESQAGTFFEFTSGPPGGVCGHTYSDTTGTTVIKNLLCGGLSLGGGGSTVPEGPTPDGATNRWAADCSGGTCTLSATNAPGSSYDCTGVGCNFGTPLPIPNAGLSTCIENKFSSPGGGSIDPADGSGTLSISLNSTAVLTGTPSQPCPICRQGSTSGPACAGSPASPCSGVCEGSNNQGAACVSTNSAGLTRDCPQPLSGGTSNRCYKGTNNGAVCTTGSQCPGGVCATLVGVIPVTLTPLTTGTSELSSATGMFCPSQAHPGCFTNPNSSSCQLIREIGSPAGTLTMGVPADATFVSTFCVGSTTSPLINGATSLPGPGATSLAGTVLLFEATTTVPPSTVTTTSTTGVPTTSSTVGTTTSTTSTSSSTSTSTLPPPGTVVLDFTTTAGSGPCGASQMTGGGTIRNLGCGTLNLGGGGSSVPEGPIPDGATNRFVVSSCVGNACTLSASSGGAAGVDCTVTGCRFGPPLPIANAGLSTCVANSFASNGSGTVDKGTGTMSLGVPLSSHVWVTGNGTQPCPRCQAVGSPGTPATGTCDRGARQGLTCMTTNSGGLSADCLPGGADGSSDLGSISVDLTPLITGTASDSDPAGLFCAGQTTGGNEGCFGSTACRAFSQTGMQAGALVNDVPSPVALASAFCIPATGNVLIDGAASLPGPGAASLSGTVVLHQFTGTSTTTTSTTAPTTTSTIGATTSTTTAPTTTTTTTLLPLPPLTIEFSSTAGTGTCGNTRDGNGVVLTPLDCGDLALGSSSSTIPPSALPDGAVNRFSLNTGDLGCILSVLTACPLGPTNVSGAGFDCTTTGCNFGPPVPVPNGALSACSVSTFTAPSTGTVNLVTGATTANVALGLHLYVTGNNAQPCPRCSATGTPTAPGTGTCDRGARMGLSCTTTNSHGLSKDCAPGGTDGSQDLGTVTANLTPVTTGTASKSNPTGIFCPGQTSPGCFGQATCRSITETGAAPNATLSAVTPQPSTLVSTFCVPSSGNVLVDGSAGLPGPAAISLQGTIRGSF